MEANYRVIRRWPDILQYYFNNGIEVTESRAQSEQRKESITNNLGNKRLLYCVIVRQGRDLSFNDVF